MKEWKTNKKKEKVHLMSAQDHSQRYDDENIFIIEVKFHEVLGYF